MSTQTASLTIPDDIKKQFPVLLGLILESESMNDGERQYWINILPIMTPEQHKNLEEILVTEKQQLQKIDEEYGEQIAAIGKEKFNAEVKAEREKKRAERTQTEEKTEEKEAELEASLLDEIEHIDEVGLDDLTEKEEAS